MTTFPPTTEVAVITITQDTPLQLARLAAQRQLYSTAKKVFAFHTIVSGPVAVASALLAMTLPQTKAVVALWAVTVSVLDLACLTPWQKRLRERAALVQEAFDCDVLGIPWNPLKAKSRPTPEMLKEQAERYERWASTMPTLNGWYPASVGKLPQHLGRLACQRANCWWDAEQRRRYAIWIVACVAVAFAVVLITATLYKLSFDEFVLKVFVPLGPTLLLGLRQYFEHIDAAARLDRLRDYAEAAWKDGLAGRRPAELELDSRRLQDEILESRRRSPFVWDRVFRGLQPAQNKQMNFAVDEMVAEAKRAGHVQETQSSEVSNAEAESAARGSVATVPISSRR
jgi:hypothetical protein